MLDQLFTSNIAVNSVAPQVQCRTADVSDAHESMSGMYQHVSVSCGPSQRRLRSSVAQSTLYQGQGRSSARERSQLPNPPSGTIFPNISVLLPTSTAFVVLTFILILLRFCSIFVDSVMPGRSGLQYVWQ